MSMILFIGTGKNVHEKIVHDLFVQVKMSIEKMSILFIGTGN